MVRKALICGVSGQDGAYLSRFLLEKGYEVVGTSRDAQMNSFVNLERLGIRQAVAVETMALTDFRSVLSGISRVQPDEIYNLAGQTSVALSFHQPVETFESCTVGTLNLLEAIRFTGRPIKLYNAVSGECFGNLKNSQADEETPFRPRSPYAVAKAAAHWMVANYREAYRLFCCSGILFNHESPLRPERFVTRKIVKTACRIARGSPEKLELGNIKVFRDWGYAPEYVDAMWRILQQDHPEDFVIATGELNSLESFAREVFKRLGLELDDHLVINPALFRATDLEGGSGNASRARERLGWVPRVGFRDLISILVEAEKEGSQSGGPSSVRA